ncbi:MAG: DNA sulfur modification protein DndD [Chloroflexi bacterium]|nr:DNA sulfur modification protein DndD [Chloroflexota bacterium]
MIFRDLKLTDFGIYGGSYTFNLMPVPAAQFNRPIVLISGKNGVGKTTFVEAIRLCLHGQAALGSRTSQQAYDAYLLSRIHRPANQEQRPTHAKVELSFEFVNRAERHTYRIVRSWQAHNNSVKKELFVWEDERPLRESNIQKEELLRELVPPGVADLFFFDGEQIRTLADDANGNLLLSDTIRALLGLNMVDQLEKDLDIFMTRQQEENGLSDVNAQVNKLREEQMTLEQQVTENLKQQRNINEQIATLNTQIAHQEQLIAGEGGAFAQRRDQLKAQNQLLEGQIEEKRRQVQELCNGLLPFTIVPGMLTAVATRLETEHRYKEWQAAQHILENQLNQLSQDMQQTTFWEAVGTELDSSAKDILLHKITRSLKQTLPDAEMDTQDVILHASDKRRRTLLGWIEQAQKELPYQFSRVTNQLARQQEKKKRIEAELAQVPPDETLQPLVEELNKLIKKLGGLEKDRDRLQTTGQTFAFHSERVSSELRRNHEQIADHEATTKQIRMAARTQLVLETFAQQLTQAKIRQLEAALVRRFNQLNRKENFVDAAQIDPERYTMTLTRADYMFGRAQLSAGERQILAIATMWALREVSGRPTPVIIDTPLSRLDSEHRLSMIQSYFPHVSHQTIVLATDAEIDDALRSKLRPAISHIYHLADNAATGGTTIQLEAVPAPQPLIQLNGNT